MCFVMAINPTSDDIELKIQPQKVFTYDTYEFLKDTTISKSEADPQDPIQEAGETKADRAESVMKSLDISYSTL